MVETLRKVRRNVTRPVVFVRKEAVKIAVPAFDFGVQDADVGKRKDGLTEHADGDVRMLTETEGEIRLSALARDGDLHHDVVQELVEDVA